MRFNLHVPNLPLSGTITQDIGDIRYQLSGNYITFAQGDIRYVLSGAGGVGTHTLLGASHSDTTGIAASGHLLSYDGTNWRPASRFFQPSGFQVPSGNYATVDQGHNLWIASGIFEASGLSATVIANHVALIDPHTQYLTESAADITYRTSGATIEANSDVVRVSTLISGHTLAFDGTNWVNTTPVSAGGIHTIIGATHSDSAGTPTISGQHLSWDGDEWRPRLVFFQPSGFQVPSGNYATVDQGHNLWAASGTFEASGLTAIVMTNHLAQSDPHTQYLTPTEADIAYLASGIFEASGLSAIVVANHNALADPHPQYLTPAEADIAYIASGIFEASGLSAIVVANHIALADPHSQYLTPAEADIAYQASGIFEASGLSAIVIANHLALSDPHTQYLTEAAADITYRTSGAELEANSNVNRVSTLVSGHTLAFDGTNWVNTTPVSAGGAHDIISATHSDSAGAPTVSGQLLIWDGDEWRPADRFFQPSGFQVLSGNYATVDQGHNLWAASGVFEASGTSATVIANHVALSDPHTQYLTEVAADITYMASGIFEASGLSATVIANHNALADPHSQYLTPAEADIAYLASGIFEASGLASTTIANHVALSDPHTQYLTQAEGDALYAESGIVLDAFAGSGLVGVGDILHAQVGSGLYLQDDLFGVDLTLIALSGNYAPSGNYATVSQGHNLWIASGIFEASGITATVIANHVALADPHTQYLTEAAADTTYMASGIFEASGLSATVIANHSALSDPHSQYLTPAEADVSYMASGIFEASGIASTLVSNHSAAADIKYQLSGANLEAAGDVSRLSTLVSGHIIGWNGTSWVNTNAPADEGGVLHQIISSTHSDTTGTASISGHLLSYDGSNWRPASPFFQPSGYQVPSGNYATVDQGHELWQVSGNLMISGDYATVTQGHELWMASGIFEVSGISATVIANHIALSDPHTQYLTEAAADTTYRTSGAEIEANSNVARVSILVSGHTLAFDGTNWVNTTPVNPVDIHTIIGAAHSDATGTPISGHLFSYDGTNWRPASRFFQPSGFQVPSGNYVTVLQGDIRYALSGTGVGVHALLGDSHSDTTGVPVSGHILGFDGTVWRPTIQNKVSGHFESPFSATDSVQFVHNLGFYPQVTVLDSIFCEQDVQVCHDDIDTTTITFNGTISGLFIADIGTDNPATAGPHTFESHSNVTGTWTSGRLTIFDGTNHVPLPSGFFVGRDELLQQYNLELDEAASSITYIGEALPGSATSSPLWRIKRLDESDSIVELIIKWADGNDDFDNVWDNRAALSYS